MTASHLEQDGFDSANHLNGMDFARAVDDPHSFYAALRASSPVHWEEAASAWFVTRYDDVSALLLDPRLGARTSQVVLPEIPETSRGQVQTMESFLGRWLVFSDPPYQTRMRRVLAPAFSPSAAGGLSGTLESHARAHVDRFVARGGGDLVTDLTKPFALAVISEFLGFRAEEHGNLVAWSHVVMEYVTAPIDTLLTKRAVAAVEEMSEYVLDVVLPRSEGPVAAALAQAMADGELTGDEAVAIVAQLLTGGIEPVSVAIAVCVLGLRDAPTALEAVRGGELPLSRAVEEAFRLHAPFHFAPRRVLEDFTLHGHLLRAGQQVALVLASANRDEQRFSRPEVFNPHRPERGHLSFGKGGHYCLGAALARLESETLIRHLEERMPAPRWCGPIDFTPSFGSTELGAVPVLI